MRISDLSFRGLLTRDLQTRLAAAAQAQRRVSSGLRVMTSADAPDDASHIVRLDAQISDVTGYRRAATNAATRLSVEESVIKSARELVQQAKTLAASVAQTDPGDPMRQVVNAQLTVIQEQLVTLGNTKLGDEFIFGGGRTDQPPFQPDGTYVGDSTERRAIVDDGLAVTTAHTGDDLFGTTMQAMTGVLQSVTGGTSTQIQASLTGLNAAAGDLMTREAETGARQDSVNRATKTLAVRNAQLLDSRDGLAAADPATSSVEMVTAQNALERAYAAVAKVLGTNLLDFLR